MNYRNVSAPARPVSRTLAAFARSFAQSVALAGAFAVATGTMASAQQPSAPGAKPAPANKPPQQQQQQPQLIFSPWTKFCRKQNDSPYAKQQTCFTRKDARNESGMDVVAAVLIEPEGDTNKILRVTLPLGLQLTSGTRVIVDSNKPMTAPFGICLPDGCLADYDASGGDLIANMKKGHGLTIQAINSTGQPISLTLPLSDFAKAYDGPPTDPKVTEEHQKLQEELQQRADEARKKLDQQQGQPQSSNKPPPDAPQAAGKP
jgi:invasion protein IalB